MTDEIQTPALEHLDDYVLAECARVRTLGGSTVDAFRAELAAVRAEQDDKAAARSARRAARVWATAGCKAMASMLFAIADARDPLPLEPALEDRVEIPREAAPTEHVEPPEPPAPSAPVVFPFELALAAARHELGVHEIPGPESNGRIEEYLLATHGPGHSEDIAWCSAFVNFCVRQTGREGTDRRAARSWLHWGQPLKKPREGCIVVFWREDPRGAKGHVGFYVGETEHSVLILGGNQLNSVCIRKYPKARVLGYRWAE